MVNETARTINVGDRGYSSVGRDSRRSRKGKGEHDEANEGENGFHETVPFFGLAKSWF